MQGRLSIVALVLLLALIAATPFAGEAQENQNRLAVGNGAGTLKVGDQKFKITSVIVKLIEDRKAEITLVSDITIFLNATWSNHAESQHEFDLQITGTESRVGLDGNGKVVLSDDGKAVARLSLKGVSRTTQRSIEANFEGK
jgi:hypothetical protein